MLCVARCLLMAPTRLHLAKLFVGNLPFDTHRKDLTALFEEHGGKVDSVKIIEDRMTGRSRGFGFVVLADKEAAEKALANLNGFSLEGRTLRVMMATAQD
eukprot:NODE_6752_length_539_cov_19.908163_g6328_i0.p2 GENE.NODE_6752_length_539_cov_19.908163_g6328_i0~~NODE_6752_length_539_cov_19.908163_g6328_i0.p2  ORF type:complete len:100 (+),score=17.29 NODE_6752_length_539_cov_19.908163_g6328_i0:118-417(+)